MDKDFMPLVNGKHLKVPGWDQMLEDDRILAWTYQAIVNYIVKNGIAPTFQETFDKIREMQEENGDEVYSKNSKQAVQRRIDRLQRKGYIFKTTLTKAEREGTRPVGRGGASRCWWPFSLQNYYSFVGIDLNDKKQTRQR